MRRIILSISTKGTQLYLRFSDTTDGYQIVKIGCPTGITGLGGAASQLDDTCLDDIEMKYKPGMPNPGQMSVNLNFDPSVISHQELWDLFNAQTVVHWVIGWSNGVDIPPTVNSTTGVITYPTTRTFTDFDGYIADLPLDFAINSLVKSAMSVQRNGARTMHYKA
jgi:hypothetical protein